MKRTFTLALAAAATFAAASPAHAGVVLVGTPGGTASPTASINFNTTYGGTPVITIPGLTSTLTLTFLNSVLSGGNSVFNFSYSIANTSTIAGGSRLSLLGFDIAPNIARNGATVTGSFTSTDSGNVPIFSNFLGNGPAELCLLSGGSCAGGGNGGVLAGQTGGGTLALQFAGVVNDVTLSDFVVRYQSFDYQGINSAVGISTAVPEPGTWMLMIAGIGLMGWQLRRRRQAVKVSYA